MAIPECRCSGTCATKSGLTGTKFGCGLALCGACTVISTGEAVRACITSVSDVVGKRGHHDRGPAPERRPSGAEGLARAQRAAMRLLPGRPDHAGGGAADGQAETRRTTRYREAMAGNICRCGCYQRIEAAVHLASTGA